MKHYLDYNATAPAHPKAIAAAQELQSLPLNASSVHYYGRKAKAVADNARKVLAEYVGVFPHEIIFMGSGSEANNAVINSFADNPVIVSAIEHASILKTAGNKPIIEVNEEGIVQPHSLIAILEKVQEKGFLVSVMLANNETGVIQPVRELADITHHYGGFFHCDAVQALGKIPLDFGMLGCDMLTLAAHKMGGLVGAAALLVKDNVPFIPFIKGGGQEKNRRAGTENIAAIAAFAAAIEQIDYAKMQMLRDWLDTMEATLSGKGTIIASSTPRLPNTSCILMPDVTSETQIIHFDLAGIAISAGSACSSGRMEPSSVLAAMQIPAADINTAIRISGGWNTSKADIMKATETWLALFDRKH